MLETKEIEIELKYEGKIPDIYEIGNQYNNQIVKLIFKNKELLDHTCFILIDNGVESGSLPIVNQELIISSEITKRFGQVKCQVCVIDEDNKELRYDIFYLNIGKSLEQKDELPPDENLENYYKKMDDKIAEIDNAIHNVQKGEKGDPGQDGSDYVITEADYTEIANIVIASLVDGDEVAY